MKKKSALSKSVKISHDLAAIINTDLSPRTEVVKLVWSYIKQHNLQDKDDRRFINPDHKLSKVLGNSKISMFKMMKEISKHLN